MKVYSNLESFEQATDRIETKRGNHFFFSVFANKQVNQVLGLLSSVAVNILGIPTDI